MNVPWTLEELLPHRPPMLLIDAVEEFDPEAKSLTARVTVAPGQIFFVAGPDGAGGVPNWVAIEYMAQTCAALAGCWDRHVAPDRPARPGLLLGTLMFAGLIAMLIGEQFKQEIETDQLNESLRRRRPAE